MAKYPVENLLRPPVEWCSSFVSVVTAILFFINLKFFYISSSPAHYLGVGFLIFSLVRFMQGYKIKHYQCYLIHQPKYEICSDNIPVVDKKLFLGKGFRWKNIHTQRLYYAQQPSTEKYLKLKVSDLLENENINSLGGNPALHGVEPIEKNVFMNLSERVGHTLVLGTTRVGKTRLLELLVTQDIHRGEVVIVFDPKGDTNLLRRIVFEAKSSGRENDVVIFHLGFPEVSARYNLIGSFARITEVANRLANQLPSSGESAAFKEFGWRFVNIIAKALVALGRKPDYQQIQRYILNIDDLLLDYCCTKLPQINPDWRSAVKAVEEAIDEKHLPFHLKTRSRHLIAIVNYIEQSAFYDSVAEGLCSAFNYDKTYFDKITASLLPLVEKLTTGRVAELISPNYADLDDKRPIFDWLQIIRGKKIVYVGLDALSDATVAAAVGNSMFADLCSVSGQLYKYGVNGGFSENSKKKEFHLVCVHSDEFNELIGDEFVPLLNKSGGAGIQVTAYTQTWSDVEARLGSKAKAGQVGGNFNTLICMRVLEEATAQILTHKLPQRVNVPILQAASSVNDHTEIGNETDFTSHNEDRVINIEMPMLTAGDLIQLPKGQAFCLLDGGQLWKIRIPLSKDNMDNIPDSVDKLVAFY